MVLVIIFFGWIQSAGDTPALLNSFSVGIGVTEHIFLCGHFDITHEERSRKKFTIEHCKGNINNNVYVNSRKEN